MPVEKISVYLPARFAGSVRAVAEQTDIVYMQFEEKQVTLLSQKPAIQIPVGFVEEPTKVKNPKTDAFSMSIPFGENLTVFTPHGNYKKWDRLPSGIIRRGPDFENGIHGSPEHDVNGGFISNDGPF